MKSRHTIAKLSALLTTLPGVALAASLGGGSLTENTGSRSIASFLIMIQDWLLGIVGGLAVLFIVFGGVQYITAGGNQQRAETAKKTLTYAIWGLVIVVLAKLIFTIITGGFLTSIFGTGTLK